MGQITSMPSIHLQSRQRDRLYARDVVSQSVVEWLVDEKICLMKNISDSYLQVSETAKTSQTKASGS